MPSEQHIPFYTHKFKDHPWNIFETEHYILHIEPDSLAERDIGFIKERQETAYAKIVETLGLSMFGQKISYYFYPSREKKEELMGDDWYGQSIYDEFTIHAVYGEDDKVVGEHEDTHLLTLQLGLPISLFQEGLAEFMAGSSMFGNDFTVVIEKGVKKGLLPDIAQLMSQKGWLDTPDEESEFYYSIAGSFITYVYGQLSLEEFKNLYRSMERANSRERNIEIFETITGKSLQTFENEWRKSLG